MCWRVAAQCDKVLPGYYMVNSTYAAECPAGSYQDMEGTVYDCNACPYGYMTRATGTGKLQCRVLGVSERVRCE